jgi:hypothetical protein
LAVFEVPREGGALYSARRRRRNTPRTARAQPSRARLVGSGTDGVNVLVTSEIDAVPASLAKITPNTSTKVAAGETGIGPVSRLGRLTVKVGQAGGVAPLLQTYSVTLPVPAGVPVTTPVIERAAPPIPGPLFTAIS